MALQIPNHMHCSVCNQAIPYMDPKKATVAERTCGPEHEKDLVIINKDRKRRAYTLYGLMGIAVLFLILSMTGVFPR